VEPAAVGPDEQLLTVHDVARRWQVPISWAYLKAETGELRSLKLGRYLRFRASDIEAYLTAQQRGGGVK
jgi:excisionase family DNA binding protein